MAKNILVVCTGNICRSPMAEVLMQDYALRRKRDLQVRSASVMGLSGNPAHRHAQAVMKEVGLDLSQHRAQPVTDELAHWADYILGMELRHSSKLRDRFPDLDDRILLLGSFGGLMEVEDPLGGWRRRFRQTREILTRCVAGFVDQIPREQP
ncbi:MAG: low molecular weight protein arginine phosphatase [Myxococcota bacterium]|nr:low molecular weight protein arginine phosphatase [Myxococcota bacterium]